MENGFIKGMFFILVILYIVSPVDVVPGPIDDVLLLLLSIAANKEWKEEKIKWTK